MGEKLYAAYTIENTLNLLDKYSNNINEKSDMKKVKNRILNDFNLLDLMSKELFRMVNNFNGKASFSEIKAMEKYIEVCTKDIRYAENINQIIEVLKRMNHFKELCWDFTVRDARIIIDDLIKGNRTLHDNLTVTDSNKIIDSININREFSIFSPRAFDGNSLFKLSNSSNGKAITYGLEEQDNYHVNAKKIVNRMIKGRLFGSTISNQVFDVLQMTAPVSWVTSFSQLGNLIEKSEKVTFRNTIKYLRPNGIFIYTMPITRITKDMAILFSKALKNVRILNKEQDNLYVHIIGNKDVQSDSREDVYRLLMEANVSKQDSLDITYNLPSGGVKQPEYFRGSVLDEEELLNLVESSGLKKSFWKAQEVEDELSSSRPLLPFNMGQVGLVLTSGCLDGTVEEYVGQCHAIKGMVTKIRNVEDDVEEDVETFIETISNKVQINLVTPDGQFIELA